MINLSRDVADNREYDPFSFSYEHIETAEYIEELIGYLENQFKNILKYNPNLIYQVKRDYSNSLFEKSIIFTFNLYGHSVSNSMRVESLHTFLNKDEEVKNKEFLKSVIIRQAISRLVYRSF